jgi:hypothetical protein
VENETEIMQDVLKMWYISVLPKCMKLLMQGGFLCAFTYVNVGFSKVNLLWLTLLHWCIFAALFG